MSAVTLAPTVGEFDRRAREGNLVPVSCEIMADLDTPISAFLRIRHLPYPFLLESAEGSEKIARYSFLGASPRLVLRAFRDRVEIHEGGFHDIGAGGRSAGTVRRVQQDPLGAARDVLARYRPVADPTLPRFYGGLVGSFGYDLIRTIERLPHQPPDDYGLPIMSLALADTVVVFDHVRHRIRIVANACVDDGAERAYREAQRRIEQWIDLLRAPMPEGPAAGPYPPLRLRSNMTRERYLAGVGRCREYVHAGDAFQIVFSQRFAADVGDLDPFAVYRAVRAINPSPFMFYLGGDDATLVGASPELLVRLEGDLIQMRPIAGTRRRGLDEAEDRQLEQEMLGSEKERAEHVMLVDLTRNDVGRVARYGTVRVPELMTVERYSHVMHIVSLVEGRLREGLDAFDVLRAVFPHGTVSGAPKVRAMEILDELEPTTRGPYAGAVGYAGFGGALDTCIAIRTLALRNGVAYVQAGGGIVADSEPAAEYDETVNKAKVLIRAIEMARRGL
ncbi:MAG TPA: anthranilate synthase component I [bacterium]|nr:anthranilate synthase component I [bacterium]